MLFSIFRKKPEPKPEMVTLTEAEFKFLASGVRDGGLLGAWSTDTVAMELADLLVSKGLIHHAGHLRAPEKTYIAWNMTSQGIDAAVGKFTPAPGWLPFKERKTGQQDEGDVS